MGYTTEFFGQIKVEPPLNAEEIEYLKKFAGTRRMLRSKGPYFVDGTGFKGQGDDPDVIDHNEPPNGQPGLWCHWVPTDDGTAIEWDGGEKFYEAEVWMKYLIRHFICWRPLANGAEDWLPHFGEHRCNGEIEAQGERSDDHWFLVVENNEVFYTTPSTRVRGFRIKV